MGSSLEQLIGSFRQQRAALLAQLERNDVYRALSTLAPTARPELRERLEQELADDRAYAALLQIDDAIALLAGQQPEPMVATATGDDEDVALTDEGDDQIANQPVVAPAVPANADIAAVAEATEGSLPAVASLHEKPFPLDRFDAELEAHAIALAAAQADRSCPEPIFTVAAADLTAPAPAAMLSNPAGNSAGQLDEPTDVRRSAAADGVDALPGSRLRRADIDATVESIAFAVASITAGRQFGRGDPHPEPEKRAVPVASANGKSSAEVDPLSQTVGDFIGEPAQDPGHASTPDGGTLDHQRASDKAPNGLQLLRTPLAASIGPRPTRPPRGRPKLQAVASPDVGRSLPGLQRQSSTLEVAQQPGHARRSAAWADQIMGKDRARPTLIGDKAGEAVVEFQRVTGSNGRQKDSRGISLTDDGIATTRDAKPRIRRFLQALTGEEG